MIALTAARVADAERQDLQFGPLLVIGSKRHKSLLESHLPSAQLVLEPFGRNSAPAIVAACLMSAPDDLLLVMPADHHITAPRAFLDAIAIGQIAAARGEIVTFGIKPDHAAIDYGYIETSPISTETEIKNVVRFTEKPEKKIAEEYVQSGGHFWNSGIFLFSVKAMLSAFEEHAPDILARMRDIFAQKDDGDWYISEGPFREVENISIDYAIMEKASNVKVVPVDMGWSDVGGYKALWEMLAEGPDSNVAMGRALVENSRNVFVRSQGPLIAASGLEDMAIIAKDDVVMIAPLADAAAVKRLGAQTQSLGSSISLSADTAQRAYNTLDRSFRLWLDVAWDAERGGFVECLSQEGVPDLLAARRVRVQARQVFSFANAILLGSSNSSHALELVDKGLNYLNSACKHPAGGWYHTISSDGKPLDETRDLYDHAFVMLAGASAYEATQRGQALQMAEQALEFITVNMRDSARGGYFESPAKEGSRRSNPHMHLLEAFLALFKATGRQVFLDEATEIVLLFERYFFDPRENILREHFNSDWTPAEGLPGKQFEPGHHYEWASLLAMYERLTGRDMRSWRTRLIKTADLSGRNQKNGFAYNLALPDTSVLDSNSRIWHQLEMFRARVLHPNTAAIGAADRLFDDFDRAYLKPAPEGGWIDELDANGKVVSDKIPASILYHLITAFLPALRR